MMSLQLPSPRAGLLILLGLGVYACDDPGLKLPPADAGGGGLQADAEPVMSPEPELCDDSPDGEACGDARHCINQRCLFNTCGDGVQAGTEECDDGNEVLGDACSPSCRSTPPHCGDARTDEDEECDDGNLIDADACSLSCKRNVCGNGRPDPGEECDDGNRTDGDSCSNACVRHLCRNGVLDPGEECDDANTNPNDGCTNACQRIVCGDGMAEQQEECDDGNRVDADACSNACTSNVCGNNRVDPGEACDGGRKADGQPVPAGSRCSANCSAVESDEACAKCERENHCTDYQGSGYDLPKYCYDEVPEGAVSTIKDFNKKCASVVDCVRRNRCDVDWALPNDILSCYCGREVSLDQCNLGKDLSGPCMEEFEAATGAPPGDYNHVLNSLTELALPAGRAYYMANCQREHCSSQCR